MSARSICVLRRAQFRRMRSAKPESVAMNPSGWRFAALQYAVWVFIFVFLECCSAVARLCFGCVTRAPKCVSRAVPALDAPPELHACAGRGRAVAHDEGRFE